MAQDNRATRATAETQTRRRRTNDFETGLDLKLGIPDAIKDAHPDKVFRWVNDTGARIHNLTVRDDYDKVEGIDPRPVGSDKDGRQIMAHLLAKPKAFAQEDEASKEQRRRDVERGQVAGSARAREDDVRDEHRYVPAGNRIGAVRTP
jgi:hypothetical protein